MQYSEKHMRAGTVDEVPEKQNISQTITRWEALPPRCLCCLCRFFAVAQCRILHASSPALHIAAIALHISA